MYTFDWQTESVLRGPARYKSDDKPTDEVVVIKIAGQPTAAPSRNINV